MLQEIIEQMYVDPELLEQLGEEQKEILFRKMREEQLRRWRGWDSSEGGRRAPGRTSRRLKRSKDKVGFALGGDGEPWVWVMGEHRDDLPYEQLVRMREQEEQELEKMSDLRDRQDAEELARQEAQGIMAIANQFGELRAPGRLPRGKGTRPSATRGEGAFSAANGSASEETDKSSQFLRVARTESHPNVAADVLESPNPLRRGSGEVEKESEVRQRTLVRKASIIGTSREEQRRFEKERADEVYCSLKRAKKIAKKRTEEMSQNVETWWREAEQKAKDFEHSRRSSIKKAREIASKTPDNSARFLDQIPEEKKKEIVRRMSVHRSAPPPPSNGSQAAAVVRIRQRASRPAPPRPLLKRSSLAMINTAPKSAVHIMRWFADTEAPRGVGREKDGSISVWFHGKLDRERSRRLLDGKPVGSYLVRLSTKLWGYTVSVRTYTECKHFLVDASSGRYHFVGPKQQDFATLTELLKFYRVNPVTWAGQEVLLLPVGQEVEVPGLFVGLYSSSDDPSLEEEEEEAEEENTIL